MTKRLILLPGPLNVVNAKTCYLDCPIGYRYHAILFAHTSTSGTQLPSAATGAGDMRVKLGGKVQRLHSLAELKKLNTTKGSTYTPVTLGSSGTGYGELYAVYFAEPWRKDIVQADFTAWPTGPGRQLQIELDLGTPSSATAQAITAYALVDTLPQPGSDKNGVQIVKVYRADYTPAAAADITTLDKRDLYQAIYATKATGGTITKLGLKADGVPIAEAQQSVAASADVLQGIGKLLDNNTGQFDAELILDLFDPLQDGFPAAQVKDFQLRIEQSGSLSGTTRILVERLGPPD